MSKASDNAVSQLSVMSWDTALSQIEAAVDMNNRFEKLGLKALFFKDFWAPRNIVSIKYLYIFLAAMSQTF